MASWLSLGLVDMITLKTYSTTIAPKGRQLTSKGLAVIMTDFSHFPAAKDHSPNPFISWRPIGWILVAIIAVIGLIMYPEEFIAFGSVIFRTVLFGCVIVALGTVGLCLVR